MTRTDITEPRADFDGSGIDLLLTVREAADLLNISVPTFWRRVADGSFPKPIKLGALSRWPRSEVLQIISDAKCRREIDPRHDKAED